MIDLNHGRAVRTMNGGWQNGMRVSDDNVGDLLDAVDPTVAGVTAIVEKIRKLAPKASWWCWSDATKEKHRKGWSERRSYLQLSLFTAAIDEINRRVEEYGVRDMREQAAADEGSVGKRGRTALQPCAEGFLKNARGADSVRSCGAGCALHPSGRGLDVLMRCITDGMDKANEEHDRLVAAREEDATATEQPRNRLFLNQTSARSSSTPSPRPPSYATATPRFRVLFIAVAFPAPFTANDALDRARLLDGAANTAAPAVFALHRRRRRRRRWPDPPRRETRRVPCR